VGEREEGGEEIVILPPVFAANPKVAYFAHPTHQFRILSTHMSKRQGSA
jgi:hypothetical protein